MFRVIEQWQSSGISQVHYCRREGIAKSTFYYWHIKYKKEKGLPPVVSRQKGEQAFIPVETPFPEKTNMSGDNRIEVFFPNGVHLNCPVGIDIRQIKTLINF